MGACNQRILCFADYGTPNNPLYDNTPDLEAALADAYSLGGAVIDFSGGKEWHFLSPLDSNNASTYAHYDNVHLRGLSPEVTAQHQEAGGSNSYKTRLVIHIDGGEVWWDQQRSYRFGPLVIEDLTFKTTSRSTVFRLGHVSGTLASACFRGLYVRGCYFTCVDPTAIQNDWLTNDVNGGYILPEHRNYAFDITRGYDVVFTDVTFLGWGGAGIRNIHGDRAMFHNCRSNLCQLIISLNIVGAGAAVGSVYSNCYAEAHPYYGMVVECGMISNFRAEIGYNAGFTPDLNKYGLPSEVQWDIAAEQGQITLSNFPSGFDATNYFFPGMVIRITPAQDVPPRELFITAVTASAITFKNASSLSYTEIALSGNGTTIERLVSPLVFVGDRCSVHGYSCGVNETTQIPIYIFVPEKKTVEITGGAETIGSAEFANPTAYAPLIVANCAGAQGIWGGLKCGSRYNAPNHPLAYFEYSPRYAANYKEPHLSPDGMSQTFLPGQGVGSSNNAARQLVFRKRNDATLGEDAWVYRISDSNVGWQCRPMRILADVDGTLDKVNYKIRCYTTGATTLSVYGGAGLAIPHSILGAGWHTVSGQLDIATQVSPDGQGYFAQIGGANIEVASAVFTLSS
jgi:hypothetical protein